ncbi:MAG: hypothetical protein QM785_05535 [Pyrinomonadaceae bacterium]
MKFITTISLVLFLACLTLGQDSVKEGAELYRAGKYAEAIEAFKKVRELKGSLWLFVGASYYQLGKEDLARGAFLKARELGRLHSIDGEKAMETTNTVYPRLDGMSRASGRGNATLAVEFKADKKIGFVFVVQTTDPQFGQNCITTARGIKFKPATSGNSPVTTVQLVEYSYFR